MKKALLFFAVSLACTAPLAAQSSEFGVLFGGSARLLDNEGGPFPPAGYDLPDDFSFSRSSVDFYYGVEIEPATMFKIRVGRIETPVALQLELEDEPSGTRYDVEGELQHLDAIVEYRYSEAFGSAGIFAGVGLYRQVAGDDPIIPAGFETTQTDYGFLVGVTADFPMTRRWAIVLDATHHWTKLPFEPRFLTAGGGVRLSF